MAFLHLLMLLYFKVLDIKPGLLEKKLRLTYRPEAPRCLLIENSQPRRTKVLPIFFPEIIVHSYIPFH